MKRLFLLLLLLLAPFWTIGQTDLYRIHSDGMPELTSDGASYFAALAMKCISQEFPNKTSHIQSDATDLKHPSEYHPAFYGCFDWHSSVHGHWMLVKLLKEFPAMANAKQIRAAIDRNLTADNIIGEVVYFNTRFGKGYERTYGWAWLLKLVQELYTSDDPQMKRWYDNLRPLTDLITSRYIDFLPKQTYPTRVGVHTNTAFGLSFALDYAITVGDEELKSIIFSRSKDYFLRDKACPVSWEPGGADFFSPCLMEVELMAKVLTGAEYKRWLADFMPQVFKSKQWPGFGLFTPVTVSDRSDMQLVHLDGLNFSRAWCFLSMVDHVDNLSAKNNLRDVAFKHLNAALPNVADGDYAGEHWLASFAVYALTGRK